MLINKKLLGKIIKSTEDITTETMQCQLYETSAPITDQYVNLYVDTNNNMLTTINSNQITETLLEGTLE